MVAPLEIAWKDPIAVSQVKRRKALADAKKSEKEKGFLNRLTSTSDGDRKRAQYMEKHREMQLGRNGRHTAMRKDRPSKELQMPKSVLPPVPSGTHANADPHPMSCDLYFRGCDDDDAGNALDLYGGDDIADTQKMLNARYGKSTAKMKSSSTKNKDRALTSLPAPTSSSKPIHASKQSPQVAEDDVSLWSNTKQDKEDDDEDDVFSNIESAPMPHAYGGYEDADGIGSLAARYEELDFEELLKNRKEQDDEEDTNDVFGGASVGERKTYVDGKEVVRKDENGESDEGEGGGWFGTDEENEDGMENRIDKQRKRRGRDFTGKRVRNSREILRKKGANGKNGSMEYDMDDDEDEEDEENDSASFMRNMDSKYGRYDDQGSTIFRGLSMPHIIEISLYIITGIILIFVMEQFVQLGVQIGKASAHTM